MSKIDEKRLWIIEARDGAWGANGICKGELVRCKECKYWEEESTFCLNKEGCYGSETTADWFCADGKRKDGEND